ncbi:DUF5685 family protein [Howardella ureilytica]|nr:DUF5685 family protein [Lachnospiraceae bacterium]
MYGYIRINEPELKVKELSVYRGAYCGLCDSLVKRHGRIAQMTLEHDMTFLVLLLEGLYEPKISHMSGRCIIHPIQRHRFDKSEITDYAADMNVLMAWHKINDDVHDDGKLTSRTMRTLLYGRFKAVNDKYRNKSVRIMKALSKLSSLEKNRCENLDSVSGAFGEVLGECFVYKNDYWKDALYNLGYALGEFIYIMDAYDDLDRDERKKEYNPLSYKKRSFGNNAEFDKYVEAILNISMAKAADIFERLPIVKNAELLRNIIYAGVWLRWDELHADKRKIKR